MNSEDARKFNNRAMDFSKVLYYATIGQKDRHWYRDCKLSFLKFFPENELELVCKLFAATSMNTSLKANITLFRKAYYQMKNDIPFEGFMPGILLQLEKVKKGEDLSGRKINSFAKAMAGDTNAVVVDIWLLRAFNNDKKYYRTLSESFKSAGASDKQYTIIENYVRKLSIVLEVQPAELSAMIWSGVRVTQSGDKTTRYEELLSAKLHNLFNVI